MSVDKTKIDKFLNSVKEDELGIHIKNNFTQIQSVIFFDAVDGRESSFNLLLVNNNIRYIITELQNLLTIVYRIEWTKQQLQQGKIDEVRYISFLTVDINYFHVSTRSIFDYIAKIICELSQNSGQIPKSFNKIQNWLQRKDSNKNRIGIELANFVMDCKWFKDIKGIRDAIVHKGSESLIFINKQKVLFQVISGLRNQLNVPEVMRDGKTVNFELYAGIYIPYLYDYLEDFSELIIKLMNLRIKNRTARNYHYGIEVLKSWTAKIPS